MPGTLGLLQEAIARAVERNPRQTAKYARLTLSTLPPSVNGLFFNKPGKGRVKTPTYTAWRNQALSELRSVQRAPLIPGTVAIVLRLGMPGRRRDLDGCAKAPLDALVAANVIEDDSNVVSLFMEWVPTIQGVEIEVRAV